MNATLVDEFKEELKGFKVSKGTIQFSMDKAPSAALLKKLLKARIAANEAKKTSR